MSVASDGSQANGASEGQAISADGRFVAFASGASNLVPGDTNGAGDVFVRDRQAATTERVSVDSAGVEGNFGGGSAAISADGRFVAFESVASNLVPGDTNGSTDIFVHDRLSGITERVSVDSVGSEANSFSRFAAISGDGRAVAFSSNATNLVLGDTNGADDVFVRDRLAGTTELVSVDSSGVAGNGYSFFPQISADGRFVAFGSDASNLVPDDNNLRTDVFVHDRQTGITERVSVSSAGVQGNDYSFFGSISADGRLVAFHSLASNLVAGDTNGGMDIFVHDRAVGTTERVSVDSAGVQGNDLSYSPVISGDGRSVAFSSASSNLVSDDTNATIDVFVHQLQTGITELVSIDSAGVQGNGPSSQFELPAINQDGRFCRVRF